MRTICNNGLTLNNKIYEKEICKDKSQADVFNYEFLII